MSIYFNTIWRLMVFIPFIFLISCGNSGDGKISKGHKDAINSQCKDTSDVKACSLEVRKKFLDDGNEFVILESGEINKDQIRKIKMECIRSKKFGLESYNNCLEDYKTAAIDGTLFEKKFAAKPKSNIESLERHAVRIVLFEQKSGDDIVPVAGGSGVIIKKNLIATNCHVTEMAKNNDKIVIFVKNINKENYDTAVLYKEAPEHDVCVIKRENRSEFSLNMKSVKKLIKFSTLSRGDFVRAIGTPTGMEGHSSQGEIQYLGSAVETATGLNYAKDTKVINHSADIAPGSSGGPLFDKNGNLIGLNTFGDEKFNFAISADHITELLNK